jgi:Flp pilus assembly protein TadD
MLRLPVLLIFAVLACAQDRWVEYRFGPFQVVTNAGEREGRETLAQLTQFRHALGWLTGKTEVVSTWPIRILLFKGAKQVPASASGLSLGRDAYSGAAVARQPLPRPLLRDCARVLLESSTGRLPAEIERGIVELLSTLETDGARITIGQPPPEAERTRDWTKLHMLTVPEDHYGKLRVLVHNLEQGAEAEPAYRNAFGKAPAEIEKEVAAYVGAASYSTAQVNGLALNPLKDFATQPVDTSLAEILLADLYLGRAETAAQARSAFESILKRSPASAEAAAGLGLALLAAGDTGEARKALQAAAEAGTTSARALADYGRLEADDAKALAALEKAAKLNPRWSEPYARMARREQNSQRKLQYLATAAKLAPRDAGTWQTLALAYQAAGKIPEASNAWASAERASASDEERDKIRDARAEIERKRIEFEAAERRREEEEKRRELEELKQKAVASIQNALDKANREDSPSTAGGKVEQWWEGQQADAKITGVLQRIDCLGRQVRLVIEGADKRPMRLLIRDTGKVVIQGGGDRTLGCGPQRPPRKITVEYFTKADAKLGTAGEAAVIEFPQ